MHSSQQLLDLYNKRFKGKGFPSGPSGLYDAVYHIMNMKGKRMRPLLLMLGCEVFGGNAEVALKPAFAMEVFHNFTLVHDDIMDNADIRRGQPTVHKQYGLNAGILAGDAMLAYAYKYLADIPLNCIIPALAVFNKTAIEIFEGQQMDVEFEKRMDVSEAEYLKMIEFKTSVLLGCCMQIGAIIAGASQRDQELIYDFGLKLGLTFQVKDDYLDSYGQEEKVGKRIGGDILQNKKTYLFIRAWNRADPQQKKQIQALLAEKDEERKIAAVKAIYEATGARQDTLNKAESLYQSALNSLDSIAVSTEDRKVLLDFAEQINKRDY